MGFIRIEYHRNHLKIKLLGLVCLNILNFIKRFNISAVRAVTIQGLPNQPASSFVTEVLKD